MSEPNIRSMADLPQKMKDPQAVYFPPNHELLICGAFEIRTCYSFQTINNKYKQICQYKFHPQNHFVTSYFNEKASRFRLITLRLDGILLYMNYNSVWAENAKNANSNEWSKFNPFCHEKNQTSTIHGLTEGLRACVIKNNRTGDILLMVTCYPRRIFVYNLSKNAFLVESKNAFDHVLPKLVQQRKMEETKWAFHAFISIGCAGVEGVTDNNQFLLYLCHTGSLNNDSTKSHNQMLPIFYERDCSSIFRIETNLSW